MQEADFRTTREYSLSRAKELAQQGSVHFDSAQVFSDTDRIGYSHEQVCTCLAQLTEAHFCYAVKYRPPMKIWLDVYMVNYASPSGRVDDLYIKFFISSNCLTLVLCSFHEERPP
jgi:hypothetical protein